MITYNDIYEAKKNPLVLFESPINTEGWHFLIDSYECHTASIFVGQNDNLQ